MGIRKGIAFVAVAVIVNIGVATMMHGRVTQGDHVEPYHQPHTHHVLYDIDCVWDKINSGEWPSGITPLEEMEMSLSCLHITHVEE